MGLFPPSFEQQTMNSLQAFGLFLKLSYLDLGMDLVGFTTSLFCFLVGMISRFFSTFKFSSEIDLLS